MIKQIFDFLDVYGRILIFLTIIFIIAYRFITIKNRKRFIIFIFIAIIGMPTLLITDVLCKAFFLMFLYDPNPVLTGEIWMEANYHKFTLDVSNGTQFGHIAHFTFRVFELFIWSAIVFPIAHWFRKRKPKLWNSLFKILD